jgi:hypothetical protein
MFSNFAFNFTFSSFQVCCCHQQKEKEKEKEEKDALQKKPNTSDQEVSLQMGVSLKDSVM